MLAFVLLGGPQPRPRFVRGLGRRVFDGRICTLGGAERYAWSFDFCDCMTVLPCSGGNVVHLVADCGVPGSLPPLQVPVTMLFYRKDWFWKGCVGRAACLIPHCSLVDERHADESWKEWPNVEYIEHFEGHAGAVTWRRVQAAIAPLVAAHVRYVCVESRGLILFDTCCVDSIAGV